MPGGSAARETCKIDRNPTAAADVTHRPRGMPNVSISLFMSAGYAFLSPAHGTPFALFSDEETMSKANRKDGYEKIPGGGEMR